MTAVHEHAADRVIGCLGGAPMSKCRWRTRRRAAEAELEQIVAV